MPSPPAPDQPPPLPRRRPGGVPGTSPPSPPVMGGLPRPSPVVPPAPSPSPNPPPRRRRSPTRPRCPNGPPTKKVTTCVQCEVVWTMARGPHRPPSPSPPSPGDPLPTPPATPYTPLGPIAAVTGRGRCLGGRPGPGGGPISTRSLCGGDPAPRSGGDPALGCAPTPGHVPSRRPPGATRPWPRRRLAPTSPSTRP